MVFSTLSLWVGAAAGAALIAFVGIGYNKLIDNPSVVRETTVKVEAQARERTLTAINEVSNVADRARAMRRYCRDGGQLYDFTSGQCR